MASQTYLVCSEWETDSCHCERERKKKKKKKSCQAAVDEVSDEVLDEEEPAADEQQWSRDPLDQDPGRDVFR